MKTRLVNGFVWLVVNENAIEIYSMKLFELYILHYDGGETLVESYADINDALDFGLDIAIEIGSLQEINNNND